MLMQTKNYVDFSVVEPKHAAIDGRLINWARWSHHRTGSPVSPMFRLYRSTEVHAGHDAPANPVDAMDAQLIQKAVSRLPTDHRLAISWAYIKRNNPGNTARALGLSMAGLAQMVRDGRQMLCNRGV